MTQPTPLMQQYFALKQEYPTSLLFFQVGDFYELFFDDAKTAAAFLGITLTQRGTNNGEPIPLCGVPVHTIDHYIAKLVKGGFTLAICDQLEPATPGKMVKRGITKVLTPGTLTDPQLLDATASSYILAITAQENTYHLVFAEFLTGKLFATSLVQKTDRDLESEIARFWAQEIIVPADSTGKKIAEYCKKLGYWVYVSSALETGQEQTAFTNWMAQALQGRTIPAAQREALFHLYAYLAKHQPLSLQEFTEFYAYKPNDFLLLDATTQKNLELVANQHDGSKNYTLFAAVNRACTSMGSRMIHKWLLRPLRNLALIKQRQAIVSLFVQQHALSQRVESCLKNMGDIERMVGRIGLKRATLQDYIHLAQACYTLPEICMLLRQPLQHHELVAFLQTHSATFGSITTLLTNACEDNPQEAGIIKKGFDERLDYLRNLVHNANAAIIAFEQAEQQKTGISSLKVRYNKVSGYAIEITQANLDYVPAHYRRQRTLSNKERYTCDDLLRLERDIMVAQQEIGDLEKTIFQDVQQRVYSHIGLLRILAHHLASFDALIGFARVARDNGYVCPTFNTERTVHITDGRHPVVEQQLHHRFIPNDTMLNDQQSFLVITGPNMGGKSTFLRQTGLIAILAQCGSFVPARAASLPLFDQVFTRLGTGDRVAEGKSTFLLEMEETAAICQQATADSLVILDEVGRGTSTHEGRAIAQAVIEYLHTAINARGLFATHYHELTHLEDLFAGIVSYLTTTQKTALGITFLHKVMPGKATSSFGIEVATLANLPSPIIKRAYELIK